MLTHSPMMIELFLFWAEIVPLLVAATLILLTTVHFFSLAIRRRKKEVPAGCRSPPHVASLIPYWGVASKLTGRQTLSFLRKYRSKFQNEPICSATLLGYKIYLVLDPKYIGLPLRRNIPELHAGLMHRQVLKGLTACPEEVLVHPSLVNPAIYELFHKHFLAADALEAAVRTSQEALDDFLSKNYSDGRERFESLDHFARQAIFCMSAKSWLSASLLQDDSLPEKIRTVETAVPFWVLGAPAGLFPKAAKARGELFHAVSSPEFLTTGSAIIRDRYKLLSDCPEAFHRSNLLLLWLVIDNSMSATFWILYYLLQDSKAFSVVQDEVRKVNTYPYTLPDLNSMEFLHSTMLEAMRLARTGWYGRKVTDDCIVDLHGCRYLLEKDSLLLSYPALVHSDPDVFESPSEFIYDRFVGSCKSKDGSVPEPPANLKFFGGGAHYCPGRKFALTEAKAFVARLLTLCDVELVGSAPPPPAKVTMGWYQPDERIQIRIQRRGD